MCQKKEWPRSLLNANEEPLSEVWCKKHPLVKNAESRMDCRRTRKIHPAVPIEQKNAENGELFVPKEGVAPQFA